VPDQLLFEFETELSKDDNAADEMGCYGAEDPDYRMPQDGVPDFGCFEAEGRWQVEGDAIRIDFAESSREIADGNMGPVKKANYFALLKPRDGQLVVVKGKLGAYGL
jgi:hypothetical protein